MRVPNLGSVTYSPGSVPTDQAELRRFLQTELNNLAAAIEALAVGHLDIAYVAPAKPRAGDLRYASGAPTWNPGSGAGIYRYTGSAWVFVG